MPRRQHNIPTFLFTDLESSTALWEEHPEVMGDIIRRHDDLLGEEIRKHDGEVFKLTGDGVHAYFGKALDAVLAAIAIQHSVQATDWSPINALRVRIAVHTGPAEMLPGPGREYPGDYYGQNINRIARLMRAAHGGQILISETTFQLVHRDLPAGSLRCLGEFQLKDIHHPENIYQVDAPGLTSDFPPISSDVAVRTAEINWASSPIHSEPLDWSMLDHVRSPVLAGRSEYGDVVSWPPDSISVSDMLTEMETEPSSRHWAHICEYVYAISRQLAHRQSQDHDREEVIEEVAQETLALLVRPDCLRRCRESSPILSAREFRAWVAVVTMRTFAAVIRSRTMRLPIPWEQAPEDPMTETERLASVHALWGEVVAALGQLALRSEQRQRYVTAFLLKTVYGLSTRDVAWRLGVPETTINNAVYSCRRYLRAAVLPNSGQAQRAYAPQRTAEQLSLPLQGAAEHSQAGEVQDSALPNR